MDWFSMATIVHLGPSTQAGTGIPRLGMEPDTWACALTCNGTATSWFLGRRSTTEQRLPGQSGFSYSASEQCPHLCDFVTLGCVF